MPDALGGASRSSGVRPLRTLAMKKLTSLPIWQQYGLTAAYMLPWVAFGVLSTDDV